LTKVLLTSDLQEAIAELCEKGSSGPTIADISNWLAGGEEENLQIMTDEEIINNVLEDDNSEKEQESSTPPIIRTTRHDDATSAFGARYKWAKENYVQTEHILTLKRLQEKVLKKAFRNKTIDISFVKTQ
jgi:DNA-directed RNA polymerase specialized sigma subunit